MNGERAALTKFTVDGDVTAMGRDDVVYDGQPQATAFDIVNQTGTGAIKLLEDFSCSSGAMPMP